MGRRRIRAPAPHQAPVARRRRMAAAAPKKGGPHRSVAGRRAEDWQQTPSDLRREGNSLHTITTAANVDDITQALALVDGIPPVAWRPGRPSTSRVHPGRQVVRLPGSSP